MTRYFAVKCQTCQALIKLSEIPEGKPGTLHVFVPPLEPIRCRECGSHHQYGSDAVSEIDLPDARTEDGLE